MILEAVVLLSCTLGISTFPLEEPEDGGKHWVVIVAGSNGWYNYRHQVRSRMLTPLSTKCLLWDSQGDGSLSRLVQTQVIWASASASGLPGACGVL